MHMNMRQLAMRALIILALVGLLLLLSWASKQERAPRNTTNQPLITDSSSFDLTNMHTQKLTLQTTLGPITLELFSELAPQTVNNFVTLAESGFYDGVVFHRVIENFMIQSGDPQSKEESLRMQWGTGGPGYTFEDEIHAQNRNVVGTIAMANAGPNTNGSQFFINVADNSFLDTKHTVFGRVIEGMDVVMAISQVETLPNDQPIDSVVITQITAVVE